MKKNKMVFITGGTGALGLEVIKGFLIQNLELIILIRKNKEDSKARLVDLLGKDFFKKYEKYITIIEGDLNNLDKLRPFLKNIGTVINLAGNVYLGNDKDELLYKTNYLGTQNILKFCSKMSNLKYLMHASTFYVSEVFDKYKAINTYEITKKLAENLVLDYSSQNPEITTSIIRPSIIIGKRNDGSIVNCNGYCGYFKIIYMLLKQKNTHLTLTLPGTSYAPVNFVFLDWVVDQINHIFFNKLSGIFNLANSSPPRLDWLFDNSIPHLKLKSEIESKFYNQVKNNEELSRLDKIIYKSGLGVFESYMSRPEIPNIDPRLTTHPKISTGDLKKQIKFYLQNFYH